MRRNEFIEFFRQNEDLNENMWQKFMKADEESEGPPQKKWSRREKMARADLIIQQKREAGETSKRKIVTAIVSATGVSRKTACGWVNHWMQQHEPLEENDMNAGYVPGGNDYAQRNAEREASPDPEKLARRIKEALAIIEDHRDELRNVRAKGGFGLPGSGVYNMLKNTLSGMRDSHI